MKLLQGRVKVCPKCWVEDVRPSRRRLLHYFLVLFLFLPYRCRNCGRCRKPIKPRMFRSVSAGDG
jgi:hypothetical protein